MKELLGKGCVCVDFVVQMDFHDSEMTLGSDDECNSSLASCTDYSLKAWLTTCSDDDFDKWLEKQLPVSEREKWSLDHMMNLWMRLSSEATQALLEFVGKTYQQSKPEVPLKPEPRYGWGAMPHEDEDYGALANEYWRKQDEIQAHGTKARMLLARAQKVQQKISFVVG